MLVLNNDKTDDNLRKKRNAYMRAILRVFPKQACRYTVKDIIWWFEELNCGFDAVTIPSVSRGPVRIWELKSSVIVHVLAQNVPAKWYGGPRVIKVYNGHMMQFLMDRILTEVKQHGVNHFIAVSKRFKALKRLEARTLALDNTATVSSRASTGHKNMYLPGGAFTTDAIRHQAYDVEYTDIMGTSEWGGKCPFNV
jgi:hypothetical protein